MKRLLIACAAAALGGATANSIGGPARAQTPPQSLPGIGEHAPVPSAIAGFGAQPGTAPKAWTPPTSPPLTDPRGPSAGRRRNVPDEWLEAQDNLAMNQDILVTPQAGACLICVATYQGPKAPSMARELVTELRRLNVPAYVFNYGEKEFREELARLRQRVEQQREALRQAGLSAEVPMRVPHMHIHVECGVLVGGYKDRDTARRELDRLKLAPPQIDSSRVKLPGVALVPVKGGPSQVAPVNVFTRAFVVGNPSLDGPKQDREVVDFATLRRLNASEEFSLLKAPRPWTLAVKVMQVPAVIEQQSGGGVLAALGFGTKGKAVSGSARADAAASNAQILARILRNSGLESYVLHTPYYTLVTVGGYDSKDDPRIASDLETLARVNATLIRRDPGLQLSATPTPIPRPVENPR